MPCSLATLRRLSLVVAAVAIGLRAEAATVVLSNHSSTPVAVEVTGQGFAASRTIAPGESAPFFSATPLRVTFGAGLNRQSEALVADAVYRFVSVSVGGHTGVQLRRIGLAGELPTPPNAAAWQVGAGAGNAAVKVLLCVDEDEPMREPQWRARLTERLKKASAIIERHSGVRLEPVGFQTWRSDNTITVFAQTMGEFERSVTPPPDAVAIGFSSQYHVEQGRHRMGGTRGPLRRHILLREWSPRVGEPERVELLVHELGHFLGAGHSPEPTSVMRPILGDRPVRLRNETVRFDPVNTLAIAMVGEEVRRRGVRDLSQLTMARRTRLQQVYTTLTALTPGEPAGAVLLQRLAAANNQPAERVEVVTNEDRSEAAAAATIEAITRAASGNQKRELTTRLSGDELADALIRAGAQAADDGKGFLIGVGVALDDANALRLHPRTKTIVERVESDRERRQRLNVLGKPSARGRQDLLKHFLVSAALAAIVGENEANLWGVGKELSDATREGGSGFSFADLAADRAGVRFARGVLAGSPPVAGLASGFRLDNYLPSVDGLEEGLPLDEVIKRFGGQGDPRFDAQIAEIDRRINALPAYSLMRLGLPVK